MACGAVERATFDSAGGLTSLIDQGDALAVHGSVFAYFEGGTRVAVQPHDQRTPIVREGLANRWSGTVTFPTTAQARYRADWTEQSGAVSLRANVNAEQAMEVEALDFVVDFPRALFVGGTANAAALPAVKPTSPVLLEETADAVRLVAPDGRWTVELTFDQARRVTLTDHWDARDRVYRLRVHLRSGLLAKDEPVNLGLTLRATARPAPAAAVVTVKPDQPLYSFDGFGGNYCFNVTTPAVEYTLEHLRHAWSRLELKAMLWDRQRSAPGPELIRDFELMQRIDGMNIPWAISLWRLPERFYVDANQKPFFTFGRQIAPERWPEVLDLLGSYLLYLKENYGAEPDFYSFNEPDLGVNVGFSADAHREMTRRIGAHFESLGLKTKLLLGDTANPRGTHSYVLPTIADPEAMKYVGALSFHSWLSGSPEQYRAWAEVAAWTGLPLIVGEGGYDPSSWRNKMFDSYAYGLKEIEQYQQLLRDAKPVSILFWQYTEDYGLVRVTADKAIEPTGRFFFMKHFSNLTPLHSDVVASSSDQADVLVSAFRKGDTLAVHIANLGPARALTLEGLTGSGWRAVTTTETQGFVEKTLEAAPARVELPARSLVTFVKGDATQ